MMYAQVSRIVRCTILGLSLVVLFSLLMPAAITGQAIEKAAAAVEGNRELGMPPTVEATLFPASDPTTLVIWYQGQAVPPLLMRALDELQRAGQVEAIDIEASDNALGQIFVLGQEDAIRTLADLTDVVAITWEGEVADMPSERADERTGNFFAFGPANVPALAKLSGQSAPSCPHAFGAHLCSRAGFT